MQDAWIDAFEESLAHARGSSPHTVKAYLTDARAFARYLEGAGKDLVSADHGSIRGWLDVAFSRQTKMARFRRCSFGSRAPGSARCTSAPSATA